MLVMDVDGTLTDGGIYMSANGEMMKRFDVKDGYGICNILKEAGIIPVIITGRTSKILQIRCEELEITEVIQGSHNKIEDLLDVMAKYNCSYNEIACIGDDLNDYKIMKEAAVCGCPKDAVLEIREISDFVSNYSGGHGAVREFIEWIIRREM